MLFGIDEWPFCGQCKDGRGGSNPDIHACVTFQQNSDLLFLRQPLMSISGNGTSYYHVIWSFVDPVQCNADQSESLAKECSLRF